MSSATSSSPPSKRMEEAARCGALAAAPRALPRARAGSIQALAVQINLRAWARRRCLQSRRRQVAPPSNLIPPALWADR
jgi:hypothetical protein